MDGAREWLDPDPTQARELSDEVFNKVFDSLIATGLLLRIIASGAETEKHLMRVLKKREADGDCRVFDVTSLRVCETNVVRVTLGDNALADGALGRRAAKATMIVTQSSVSVVTGTAHVCVATNTSYYNGLIESILCGRKVLGLSAPETYCNAGGLCAGAVPVAVAAARKDLEELAALEEKKKSREALTPDDEARRAALTKIKGENEAIVAEYSERQAGGRAVAAARKGLEELAALEEKKDSGDTLSPDDEARRAALTKTKGDNEAAVAEYHELLRGGRAVATARKVLIKKNRGTAKA